MIITTQYKSMANSNGSTLRSSPESLTAFLCLCYRQAGTRDASPPAIHLVLAREGSAEF